MGTNEIHLIIELLNLIILLLSVIFIIPQIKLSSKSRFFEVVSKVFDEIHSKEFTELKIFVFDNIKSYEDYSPEERKKVERYIEIFEKFCFYIDKKLLSRKVFLDMYSRLVIKSWENLEDYIYVKRDKWRAINYAEYFEKVYIVAKKYRRKKYKNR